MKLAKLLIDDVRMETQPSAGHSGATYDGPPPPYSPMPSAPTYDNEAFVDDSDFSTQFIRPNITTAVFRGPVKS